MERDTFGRFVRSAYDDALSTMANESGAIDEQQHGVRVSLGLLTSVFESMPVALHVWDAACQTVLSNAAFEKLFDATSYREFWEQRQLSTHLASAVQGQTVRVSPLRCAPPASGRESADHTRRAIACTLSPLPDEQGRIAHVLGTFVDVTAELASPDAPFDSARKAANDQTTLLAEERLRLVVDNAPVAFFSLDREGRYTCVEGQRLKRLGVTAAQIIGRSVFEVAANDPVSLEYTRRALAGETVTFRGDSIAGGTFECRFVPTFGEAGRVTGLTGISYDVTEQDSAERALRKSEEHLRLALAAGRLVTFELDLKSGAAAFSSNAREMFGARDELRTLQDAMDLLHPDDLQKVKHSLAYGVEHGVALPDVQYRLIRPLDGETIWLERRLTFVRNDAGVVTGVRGLLIDVSARVRLDEIAARSQELMLENARIVEADRLKSNFLATMSHELRTPLNAVIGFAELLHDGVVDLAAPAATDCLGHILSGGRHLLRLIDELLDIAKMESGKMEFRPERVVLSALVHEVCLLLRGAAERKQARVSLELDATLADIVLDPTRFKQVMFNYLSNALRFTRPGGLVTVRTIAVDEHTFRLEVEDHGPGIASADVVRLFREFQQLEASPDQYQRGTGLGLMLTRALVEAQGGAVGVRSTPGVGSTFTATLPRARAQRYSSPVSLK